MDLSARGRQESNGFPICLFLCHAFFLFCEKEYEIFPSEGISGFPFHSIRNCQRPFISLLCPCFLKETCHFQSCCVSQPQLNQRDKSRLLRYPTALYTLLTSNHYYIIIGTIAHSNHQYTYVQMYVCTYVHICRTSPCCTYVYAHIHR